MKRTLLKILSIFIILIVGIYLYGRYINTTGLVIHEIPVYNSALNPDYNGLKIAHISDIHYGRTILEAELKNIVTKTNELNPDIIIF
ncbi:MAG: hypothetical protein K2J20_00215, partial [Bacilli bacterium]|nr:hypothetical protein [Bacilli bacterium]